MADVKWNIRALEFGNCNCSYGCPCQFSALPTHGDCRAIMAFRIETGRHGETPLNGLNVVNLFSWPGAVHQGHGQAAFIVDRRANEAQRNALLRILSGQDTEPGATIFSVFATTFEKVHEPMFADIQFDIDIEKRRARVQIPGCVESRGEPILNPVTKAESRVRIDNPNGFEFKFAEIGRGWSKTKGPVSLDLADSYGHFCHLNLSQSGVID